MNRRQRRRNLFPKPALIQITPDGRAIKHYAHPKKIARVLRIKNAIRKRYLEATYIVSPGGDPYPEEFIQAMKDYLNEVLSSED